VPTPLFGLNFDDPSRPTYSTQLFRGFGKWRRLVSASKLVLNVLGLSGVARAAFDRATAMATDSDI
jgi:hypothetical protein